jgi:hypothetical protein
MVAHNGITANVDGKDTRKNTNPINNPLPSMLVAFTGVLIDAA